MSQPVRLLREGTDTEKQLLEAALDDIPPDLEARTLAALGLDTAAPNDGAGADATPTTGAARLSALAKWGPVIGVGAVVLALGAVSWTERRESSPQPSSAQLAAPPPPPARDTKAPVESPRVEATVDSPAIIASAAAPKPASIPAPSQAAPPKARTDRAGTLADEVAALDRVRQALATGNGGAALTALGSYDSKFPRGLMRSEAQLLRVRALLASGNRSAAVNLGEQLIARNPKGLYARQIRQLMGETPP